MIDAFWIGVLGMFCILVAFLLHMAGKWKANLRRYIGFNCLGSALLAYYALAINSIPFLFLNAVLALAAGYALIKSERWRGGRKREKGVENG